MLRRLWAAAVITSCLLIPASTAFASGADVIIDCNDNGRLTKDYSQKEYRQALAQMPADVRQYTDCENIIRRAQLGLPSLGTSKDPFAGATPEEIAQAKKDIEQARRTGGTAQRIGTALVTPGALAFTKVTAAVSELPTPLLVLVILILLGAGLAAAPLIENLRRRLGRRGDTP